MQAARNDAKKKHYKPRLTSEKIRYHQKSLFDSDCTQFGVDKKQRVHLQAFSVLVGTNPGVCSVYFMQIESQLLLFPPVPDAMLPEGNAKLYKSKHSSWLEIHVLKPRSSVLLYKQLLRRIVYGR